MNLKSEIDFFSAAHFDHVMLVSVVSGVIIFVFGIAILYLLWRRYRQEKRLDTSSNSGSPISSSGGGGKGIYGSPTEIRNNLKSASSVECLTDLEFGRSLADLESGRSYVRTCSPIPPLLLMKKENCGSNLLRKSDAGDDDERDENWAA